jgi:hypothetical protein
LFAEHRASLWAGGDARASNYGAGVTPSCLSFGFERLVGRRLVVVWQELGLVFAAGCIGGFINGTLYRQKQLKKLGLCYELKDCKTQSPGSLANVLLGGIAAAVFWCLHGPYSGATVLGTSPVGESGFS